MSASDKLTKERIPAAFRVRNLFVSANALSRA
jgi:hypothetical protein